MVPYICTVLNVVLNLCIGLYDLWILGLWDLCLLGTMGYMMCMMGRCPKAHVSVLDMFHNFKAYTPWRWTLESPKVSCICVIEEYGLDELMVHTAWREPKD